MLNGKYALNDRELEALSQEIRHSVFQICEKANSGHIGGCSGAVELITTLYFGGILRQSVFETSSKHRDRVLVRGHLGPLRYKIFSLLGYIDEAELGDYRKFGSRLPGHEDHKSTPGVDITPSGSLGMILSYGAGSALAAKKTGSPYMTYVFIGDGEEQEGSVSEAARHSAHLHLDNLIAIIDQNTKQLSNPTVDSDSSDIETIWKGYGWETVGLDKGHEPEMIRAAYKEALAIAAKTNKPVVIVARTEKGRGIEGCADHFSGYHTIGTCRSDYVQDAILASGRLIESISEDLASAKLKIADARKADALKAVIPPEEPFMPVSIDIQPLETTPHNPDDCQMDYFQLLGRAVASKTVGIDQLFFLTADVTKKDDVRTLGLEQFCTFLNVGIREQHSIALAHGLSLTLPRSRVIVNTLDAFTYRSLDQVNAAAQGGSSMVIISDVSGLTNARNGKTHQTSGQPGALLTLPGVTFLEPWDIDDVFNCLNWAIGESRGVVFIRVHSSDVKISGVPRTEKNVDWYVVRNTSAIPDLTIVASGLTVGCALEAAGILATEGIDVKVINLINHKAINQSFAELITQGKPLMTVYNGNASVLQMNVAKILLEHGRAPSRMLGLGFNFGKTGRIADLLQASGLDAKNIVISAKKLIG